MMLRFCCGESPCAAGLNSSLFFIGRCMLRVAVADLPTHREAPGTTLIFEARFCYWLASILSFTLSVRHRERR